MELMKCEGLESSGNRFTSKACRVRPKFSTTYRRPRQQLRSVEEDGYDEGDEENCDDDKMRS